MKQVEIALPIGLNHNFSYLVPDEFAVEQTLVGRRAMVNFHGRKMLGYIVGEANFSEENASSQKWKTIEKLVDKTPIFTPRMIEFAAWIADYYFSSVGEALSLMVPRGVRPKKIPYSAEGSASASPVEDSPQLTPAQQKVYDAIKTDETNGRHRFYLYGITGSGKTEIYIKLIEDTLAKNQQVIFLVPEIALSYQTLQRLRKRFGTLCAVLHSGLSGSNRLSEYTRLFHGEARIAIGPRSALFAPVDRLGLIIIDEEHEGAYKSEETPRFHARSTAFYLAEKSGATVLLGSATPSVESWYHAQNGFLKCYQLKERYSGISLPKVKIIDSIQTPANKILSPEMSQEINRRLLNQEQVLLLQNRRGFSNYIECSSCHAIINCPRCSISLTYHKEKERLICHRCGYTVPLPKNCPECGETKLKRIGAGTQKVEEEIQKIFPHAIVTRIDYDAVQKTKNLQESFERIERKEIQIIIGTQMVAKGLHFPGIQFVGIVNADIFLNIPDFKSSERAFSLITQVSGRAGRTNEQGLVMIQTMNPEHYSITSSIHGDFEMFYRNEIEFRKMAEMPPFKRLLRLVVRSKKEEAAKEEAERIKETLTLLPPLNIDILGVSPCMIPKINSNFRYQILLKSAKLGEIQKLVREMLKQIGRIHRECYLEIDADPVDLF